MRVSRRRFMHGAGVAGLALLAACGRLPGQQPAAARVYRIAWLSNSPTPEAEAAIRDGLQELGYVEGHNLLIDRRAVERPPAQLPEYAAELLAQPTDVLLTTGTFTAEAARAATSTVPIVMVYPGDPVAAGLAESLGRPGGNVTGLTEFQPQLIAKRLELLRETVPSISRVAVPVNPDNPNTPLRLRGPLPTAAEALGVQLITVAVRLPDDLDAALETAVQAGAEAAFWLGGGGNFRSPAFGARLVTLTAQHHLPAICGYGEWARAGVLMAYAPNYYAQLRYAATYIGKIFTGTQPKDLPIEQPREFDFIINLRTARTLSISIPQHVLLQATEVIQ